MALNKKRAIPLLFYRPGEPIFMPKQGDNILVLDIPDNYLTPRHQQISTELRKKWLKDDIEKIPVNNVAVPDLTEVLKMRKTDMFLFFVEEHQRISQILIDIFMKQRTIEDLISVAAYCHDRVNPYLFNYSLAVALLHRPDTKDIELPNFLQCFPGKFINSSEVIKARQEAKVVPAPDRQPVHIPQMFTANMLEPEQKVAYFREDIGINLHYWHWHLVYPQRSTDITLVKKDRRGELFYYMHQQVIARYNAERLSNGMERVKPLNSLRDAIPEGYFNKLVQGIASRAWPPRFPNITLKDVVRGTLIVKIADLEKWEANINEAIKNKVANGADGICYSLANPDGIDILGNMVESSMLSINRPFYGNYCNMGHVLLGFCHDPDGRFIEGSSVIADTSTAMRDPVFYRWHDKINNIFLSLKDQHPCYTKTELTFTNISVTEFKVTVNGKPDNQFNTYWEQHGVDFSRGLDFVPLGPVTVRFIHLQHEPFTYFIKVNNATGKQKTGYARIFMAPKFNEKGAAMTFNDQRRLMIELDKFTTVLNTGVNIIKRQSIDSSVTISFEKTFNTIHTDNFCGCGWPQHMLIPKGNEIGMQYELFVMISDYDFDKVVQKTTGPCNDADSYCGIRDGKYPDTKSMGYPFDRKGGLSINKLADFLTPNMKVTNVVVKFTDKIEGFIPPPPPPLAPGETATTQPATTQPTTTQPATTQPATTQPATTQPKTMQPTVVPTKP